MEGGVHATLRHRTPGKQQTASTGREALHSVTTATARTPGESNEHRTSGTAQILQVVDDLPSRAHQSRAGGSHHFRTIAACKGTVLGRLGRAAAATSIFSLWRLLGWRLGRSPMGRPPLSAAQRTATGEGAGAG